MKRNNQTAPLQVSFWILYIITAETIIQIMQKILFIVIFIAICFQLEAQILTTKQTKVIGDFIEEFYVLQMDTSVKHGLYTKQTISGLMVEKGYYNNGEKAGKWNIYYLIYHALPHKKLQN